MCKPVNAPCRLALLLGLTRSCMVFTLPDTTGCVDRILMLAHKNITHIRRKCATKGLIKPSLVLLYLMKNRKSIVFSDILQRRAFLMMRRTKSTHGIKITYVGSSLGIQGMLIEKKVIIGFGSIIPGYID